MVRANHLETGKYSMKTQTHQIHFTAHIKMNKYIIYLKMYLLSLGKSTKCSSFPDKLQILKCSISPIERTLNWYQIYFKQFLVQQVFIKGRIASKLLHFDCERKIVLYFDRNRIILDTIMPIDKPPSLSKSPPLNFVL